MLPTSCRQGRPNRFTKHTIESEAGVALSAGMVLGFAAARCGRPHSRTRDMQVFPVGSRRIVCAETPKPFMALGAWYQDFSQTTDDEVRELLARAARQPGSFPIRFTCSSVCCITRRRRFS